MVPHRAPYGFRQVWRAELRKDFEVIAAPPEEPTRDNNKFRRIIMCCIQTKEYGKAAEVFNAMPESGKNSPLSRFLMFKVALRTSDDDLGE
jgi:hypothetical protein